MSDWNSSVVIVPKPGLGNDVMLCADFRDLNDRTCVSFHQDFRTVPIRKDAKRFSTITGVLRPTCKPAQ